MDGTQINLGAALLRTTGRRGLLIGAGALAGGMISRSLSGNAIAAQGVFSLGVASGDLLPEGIVLWTRLAPDH